jgi:hypothetical protein
LADEAYAKKVIDEAEAQRKAEALLKQQQLRKTPSTPSMPNLGIVNVPPQDLPPSMPFWGFPLSHHKL